jgi:hypothetical protein
MLIQTSSELVLLSFLSVITLWLDLQASWQAP